MVPPPAEGAAGKGIVCARRRAGLVAGSWPLTVLQRDDATDAALQDPTTGI